MKNHRKETSPVYLDCRFFNGSGIGTYMENLVKRYEQIDPNYPIELLVKSDFLKNSSDKLIYPCHEYNAPIYSLREQFQVLKKISPHGVFHSPHYNAPLAYKGKLIVTVHDVCHVAMKQFFPGLLKRIYSEVFLNKVLQRADTIITVSEFSKNEIIRFFKVPGEKIEVIYNAVDSQFKHVEKEQRLQVLKKHGLPQEFFLFLGNVKPHKNIVGLVKSYQIALQEEPDLPPLVVLGKYDNLVTGIPHLKELIRHEELSNRIIFTGYLPAEDLPAIYSQAQLFLFPSFYEGFGFPPLEAMACKTPVISSNAASLPEVLGDAAYMVDPFNTEAIAQSILTLSRDSALRKKLIDKGVKQVSKFSWEESAQKHLEIYSKSLKSNKNSFKVPQKKEKGKKRILFLDQFGDRVGGGQLILLDILKKFRESGQYEIFISLPHEGPFSEMLKENGFTYWCIPTGEHSITSNFMQDFFRYTATSMQSATRIKEKIKKHDINIVYCNGGRTFLASTLLSFSLNINVFWHLHLFMGKRQLLAVKSLGLTPKITKIIAVSNTLLEQYKESKIYKKLSLVYNWVSHDFIETPLPKTNKPDPTGLKIGVLGMVCHTKGQWTILKSLQKSQRILPIELRIYGDVPKENKKEKDNFQNELMELSKKGWDIKYMGFHPKPIEIYDQLDILLIPSLSPEAFGLTAIEAMARKVIVFASRAGALKEIIKNGETGFHYEPTRHEELITLIEKAINQELDIEKVRCAAYKWVLTHCNPQRQLNDLYQLVDENSLSIKEL